MTGKAALEMFTLRRANTTVLPDIQLPERRRGALIL